MATGNEIASAWVSVYAKMPGIKGDIEKSLGETEGTASGVGQ